MRKRLVAGAMAAVMVSSAAPVQALAADAPAEGAPAEVQAVETEESGEVEEPADEATETEPAAEAEPETTPATDNVATAEETPAVNVLSADAETTAITTDTTWSSETTLSGNLTVAEGVTLTIGARVTISGDVTISGGGTIKRAENFKAYMLVVPEGSSLTLQGVTLDGGAVWGDSADNALGRGTTNTGVSAESAMIFNAGDLTVADGSVLQNNSNTSDNFGDGGVPAFVTVVSADNGKGGRILSYPDADGETRYGGAVLNGGNMTVEGGTIKNNQAFRGAGVCSFGVLTMTGGSIASNHTEGVGDVDYADGAGVYLSGGRNCGTVDNALDWKDEDVRESYFEMTGGSIEDNASTGSGGGIIADNYSKLYIKSGASITGNVCGLKYAGATGAGVNFNYSYGVISGGTISKNENLKNATGGVNVGGSCIVSITGGTISENKTNGYGGGVSANSSAQLSIADAKISKNEAATGAGLYAASGASVTLNDGVTITENKATSGGAGIHVNAASVTMNGGSVTKNTLESTQSDSAQNVYGTVYIAGNADFTMNGGTISENSVDVTNKSANTIVGYGGGVSVVSGSFKLADGTISENTVTATGASTGITSAYGAGVYVNPDGTFVMEDGDVTGNMAKATRSEDGAAAAAQGSNGLIYAYGGGVYLSGAKAQNSLTGGTIAENTATATGSNASSVTANGGGLYVDELTCDLTVDAAITGNKATADQDGSGVSYANGGGVYVEGKASTDVKTVTLTGDVTENAVSSDNKASGDIVAYGYGGGLYVANASMNVSSSINENTVSAKNTDDGDTTDASAQGGGVYFAEAGTLTLGITAEVDGNTIESSGAAGGAGIATAGETSGTIVMNGGSISDNMGKTTANQQAQVGGGGVALGGNKSFTMNDGQISDNVADGFYNGGGAVRLADEDATFTLVDGTISGNIAYNGDGATSRGGGAFYMNGGTLNIQGGRITGNAGYYGGAISFIMGDYTRGKVNITGGSITGNYCTGGYGGAIYMPVAGEKDGSTVDETVTISGNPFIAGNKKGATITREDGAYTIGTTGELAEQNIYLAGSTKDKNNETLVLGGALTTGATIGVTTQENPTSESAIQVFTEKGSTNSSTAAQYVVSDARTSEAKYVAQAIQNGGIELAVSNNSVHSVILDVENASVTDGAVPNVENNKDYSATITADEGYYLPETLENAPAGVTYSPDTENVDGDGYVTKATIKIDKVSAGQTISVKAIAKAIESTPNTMTITGTYGEAITSVDLSEKLDVDYVSVARSSLVKTYAVTEGTLPDGLKLDELTGVLSGTPEAVTSADGTKVTVTLTAGNGQTDEVELTIIINKAEQDAPAAPELASAGSTSITLVEVPANGNGAAAEYSKDGGETWQSSPVFENLEPGTEYTFAVRYAETDNHEASDPSPAATFSTAAEPVGPDDPDDPDTPENPDEPGDEGDGGSGEPGTGDPDGGATGGEETEGSLPATGDLVPFIVGGIGAAGIAAASAGFALRRRRE